jgi:uncharacterized damage-inducible protein DinB
MKLTDLFLSELESEAAATRRTLERVPDGRSDWKPHEKSMTMGRLAALVASMPSWIDMVINLDELDMRPPGGPKYRAQEGSASKELVEAFDRHVVTARQALAATTEEHLMTRWRLLAGGQLMSEQLRYEVIRDGVFNHLAHHRGQLTVYLRLNGASVPAIYGPSADEA